MKRDCDNGHHKWEYSDGTDGSAPFDNGNGKHIIEIECQECGQQAIEIYTFEGIEELNEN